MARALRDAGVAVAGGFDTRVEKNCLGLLLRGAATGHACPPVRTLRAAPAWAAVIGIGRLRLESSFDLKEYGTPLANAKRHNEALGQRAAAVRIAYAYLGGGVKKLALAMLTRGNKPV